MKPRSMCAASTSGGNFRLLNRLLTQVERILEINALPTVTKEVVEAARENLVIGHSEETLRYAVTQELCAREGQFPEGA